MRAQLSELPKPLEDNLPLMLHGKIMDFDRELREHLDGGAEDFPFQNDWYKKAIVFRNEMMDSRPVLTLERLKLKDQITPDRCGSEMLDIAVPWGRDSSSITIIDDSDDDVSCESSPSRKRSKNFTQKSTPQKKVARLTDILSNKGEKDTIKDIGSKTLSYNHTFAQDF